MSLKDKPKKELKDLNMIPVLKTYLEYLHSIKKINIFILSLNIILSIILFIFDKMIIFIITLVPLIFLIYNQVLLYREKKKADNILFMVELSMETTDEHLKNIGGR